MGWGAAIGAVIGLVSNGLQQNGEKKQQAAQEEARRKQKIELVKQMNWQEASTRLEVKNLLDQAQSQLGDIQMGAIRNRSAVTAAIGESGMEGRTMKAVQRNVEAADLRAAARVTENYERDYATIMAKRESEWMASRAEVDGMKALSSSSKASGVMGMLTGAVQGGMAGDQLQTRIK